MPLKAPPLRFMDSTAFAHAHWRDSPFGAPSADLVHESLPDALFRAASLWPDRAAVLADGRTYSFEELSHRVLGLAEEIRAWEIGRGPIGLLLSPGVDLVAAWFACSLAGSPFVLLEPTHPTAHLKALLERAGCSACLVDERTAPALEALPLVRLFRSDGRRRQEKFGGGLPPEDVAILFPTSGSTGQPKLITYAATTLQAKVQSSVLLMDIGGPTRVLIAGSASNFGFLHHALVFLFSDVFGGVRIFVCHKPMHFGLGQGRVDLLMANVMHQDRWPTLAALQLGDQVMLALLHARRNGPQTQRADRVSLGQSGMSPAHEACAKAWVKASS